MMGYLFGAMLAMGSGHKMPDVYEIKEQIRRQKQAEEELREEEFFRRLRASRGSGTSCGTLFVALLVIVVGGWLLWNMADPAANLPNFPSVTKPTLNSK